jgi:hypothetical protein
MIEKFKTPTNLFEFRRIVFLVLQENLDDFVDAVIHQNRHQCKSYISIRFNEKTKCDGLPDVNLVLMAPAEFKLYCQFQEQRVQAAMDADDDDEGDDDEGDDDDDQGDDGTPPDDSPVIEFSVSPSLN